DRHRDRFSCLTGCEGQCAAGGGVIVTGHGRGAVGGGIVHGHRLPAGGGKRDDEVGIGGARIPFHDRTRIHRERRSRVVVDDGAHALPAANRGIGSGVEVHVEDFVGFVQGIARHPNGNRLGRFAGRKSQIARCRGVVGAGCRRIGGGGVGGSVV